MEGWAYSVFEANTVGMGVASEAAVDDIGGGGAEARIYAGVGAFRVRYGVGEDIEGGRAEVPGTGGGDGLDDGCGGRESLSILYDGCCGAGGWISGVRVGRGQERREGTWWWGR